MKIKLKENAVYFVKTINGDEIFTRFIVKKKKVFLFMPMIIKNIPVDLQKGIYATAMGPYVNATINPNHCFMFDPETIMLITDDIDLDIVSRYFGFWSKLENGEYAVNLVKDESAKNTPSTDENSHTLH